MKVIQKAALSIILSLVLFAGFTVIAFSSLFDIIETKYYNNKIVGDYEKHLNDVLAGIEEYSEVLNKTVEDISEKKAIKRVFLTNQSKEDIFQRNNLIKKVKKENIYFKYVRVVDDEGKIHYSTNENDINSREEFRVIYKTYKKALSDAERDRIDNLKTGELLFSEKENNIFVKNDLEDEFGIKRGFIQAAFEYKDLEQYLKKNYLLDENDNIALIGDTGVVLNLFDKSEKVSEIIRNNWEKTDYEKIKYIYEDESGKEYALLTFRGDRRFSGIVLLREIFQIDQFYRYILLIVTFFVFNIVTFLIFNLRQDRISVISDRVKRFQINFLIEYLDTKHEIDWKRWKKELKSRKEEVKREVKKGIRGIKSNQEEEVNLLIDKSWDEIIGLLAGRFEEAPGKTAANIEISNIDEIVKKILKSELDLGSVRTSAAVAEKAPAKKTLQPVEVEEVEELGEPVEVEEVEELGEPVEVEELEELGEPVEAEELEELGEPVEAEELEELGEPVEVEEVEELGEPVDVEALEEAEVPEDLEEIEGGEEVEELGEPVEVEEVEELGEPVEVEELEEAEVPEDLEEIEGGEEVEELGEPVEVEALEEAEVPEDLEEIEGVEEVEELGEPVEVEEVEELGEAVEVEEVEEAEVPEDLEEIEGVEEVEELGEPVEVEEVEEAEVPEDLEEIEGVEEVEELGEPVEVEALEEAEVPEDLEEIEGVEEVEELGEPVEVEEVEELEEVEALEEIEGSVEAAETAEIEEELIPADSTDLKEHPDKYKNIAEHIISEDAIKMVVSAAEKGFIPLSEPETKDEIDKLNLFIRKNKIDDSAGELSALDENELVETIDAVSEDGIDVYRKQREIESGESELEELELLEEVGELEELGEEEAEAVDTLEEVEDLEEVEVEKDLRELEELEELELVKEIIPLIIEKDKEEVEYLEPAVEKDDFDEYDVEYISSEWIKEYNRNINVLDNVFEEIRKQKMEENTGFAEMAVLEEIKDIEYHELENLTLSDKLKMLKKEKLLEIYDIKHLEEIYKKLPGFDAEKEKIQEETMKDADEDSSVGNFPGISGIFAKAEIDLPVFDDEGEFEEIDEEKIEIDINKIITDEYGFDFDMYSSKYTGESSIANMKALLKISREVKSIYGAVLVQDETRYYPEMSVGLNKINTLLELKKKDEFYSEILKDRKIFYLKAGTEGFPEYDNIFSDEDRSFIKSILLIPIKFRKKQAYLFLSPDVKTISIEDMLEKVHNLQK